MSSDQVGDPSSGVPVLPFSATVPLPAAVLSWAAELGASGFAGVSGALEGRKNMSDGRLTRVVLRSASPMSMRAFMAF
ncbi:hypothetical protein ABL57_19250 [Kocuria sp. SM24M-10]|nr:hypothetical protein ABL57_19250 [Kocuria sp. SM24M-10]